MVAQVNGQPARVLVTGASGFIGSFLVERALQAGMQVWAGVRPSSSKEYLKDPNIRFANLDFSSEEKLREVLRSIAPHYIIHAAGLTKSLRPEAFMEVNAAGTERLARAAGVCGDLRKFVLVSSLSVMGPAREQEPHVAITDADTPQPNTLYGRSKLEAERRLAVVAAEREIVGGRLPYCIVRPTGVYGPRERDYFLMVKSVKGHVDFRMSGPKQHLTFVYVTDLVEAIFLSLVRGVQGRAYFISDGRAYPTEEFSALVRRRLGNPWLVTLPIPGWLLRIAAAVGDKVAALTGKPTPVNTDKYNILRQRNWLCDIAPAVEDLGYGPRVCLEEGVGRAVDWYVENKWI